MYIVGLRDTELAVESQAGRRLNYALPPAVAIRLLLVSSWHITRRIYKLSLTAPAQRLARSLDDRKAIVYHRIEQFDASKLLCIISSKQAAAAAAAAILTHMS